MSDTDLASLFGLSVDEMSGLGLDVPEDLLAADDNVPSVALEAAIVSEDEIDAEMRAAIQEMMVADPAEAPASPAPPVRRATPLRRVALPSTDPPTSPPLVSSNAEPDMLDGASSALPWMDSLALDDDLLAGDNALPAMSAELAAAFAEESSELLDTLHVELEALERAADDWGALREARRDVHTLKGAASVCGYERVVRVAHACEDLLDGVLKDATPLPDMALRLLFEAEPVLREAVETSLKSQTAMTLTAVEKAIIARLQHGVTAARASDPPPSSEAVARTGGPTEATTLGEPPVAALPESADGGSPRAADTEASTEHRTSAVLSVPLDRVDDLVDKVTEVLGNRAASQEALSRLVKAATEAGATAQRLQRLVSALAAEYAVIGLSAPAQSEGPGPRRPAESGVSARLQTLLLQLEEATADEASVVTALKSDIVSRWVLGAAEQRLNADVLSILLGIRLVPLGNLRVRLDRAVRSAATSTAKQVALTMHGGHIAVEKNVFDRLFEPLLHLIRNSVDHGIESPATRQRLGKPLTGSITITATEEGNEFVVTMVDDGAGIDPEAVARRAVERGIVPAGVVATMTDQQKRELIFIHGFSTAAAVGDLSGRGIGMDVVRETCIRMGGSLSLASVPGEGTTVIMRLPTSLSLAHVMVVRDGATLAALPATAVRAVHLAAVADIEQGPHGVGISPARCRANRDICVVCLYWRDTP